MNNLRLPEECDKQWEILLLLMSSEEKKIDRTTETEIDTMSYFYSNEGVSKILLQWLKQMHATYARKVCELDTALKDDEISLLWRQKGNDKFRTNVIGKSYKCYSKSVMYAHQRGPMYPLALANRSAALLKMKKFEECLSDIDLAIEHGYPIEQRHKLHLRQADCYMELNQRLNAVGALDAAKAHAQSLSLTPTAAAEFDRHIRILERKLELLIGADEIEENFELPQCYNGENKQFVSASNAIELRRSDSAGRYVVTTEATRRGDVLFLEEPYAFVALPSESPVCENCCQPDINPLPCVRCSRSVYCSVRCRDTALRVFHRWECAGSMSTLFPTIGIAHLALRVLLVSTENGFPAVPGGSEVRTAADLFRGYSNVDNVLVYNKDTPDFFRMFNLVTNFDKMNNTDYIQYALTAAMMTLYLENFTSFFEYMPNKVPYQLPPKQVKLFAAALMLRSLGQLVCNGHAALSLATIEEDDGNERTLTEREVRRATAIYPSAAMMNHSCAPNIINTFHKSQLIIRCSRELPAGAEVLNCYGPHKAREPTSQRKAKLRAQYMFTCSCSACTDTNRRDFVLLFSAYACQSCKGPVQVSARPYCPQCRAPLDVQRARALLDAADDLAYQAERAKSIEERCEKATEAFRLKQQALHRHHTELRREADRLARLYADTGEFNKSVELIKQNIQSLEYQFGSFSVEVAHELRKLSDVMLERIINSPQHPDYRDWCLETHKVIKKAVQLMDLNYGSWEPLVKRLKAQEALVAGQLADTREPDAMHGVHHSLHYNLKI